MAASDQTRDARIGSSAELRTLPKELSNIARPIDAVDDREAPTLMGNMVDEPNAGATAAHPSSATSNPTDSDHQEALNNANLDTLLAPDRLWARLPTICQVASLEPLKRQILVQLLTEYQQGGIKPEALLQSMMQVAGRSPVLSSLGISSQALHLDTIRPQPTHVQPQPPQSPSVVSDPSLAQHPLNGRFPERSPNGDKQCENCGTTNTPLWRRDKGANMLLCNACGIYYKNHGRHRPIELATAPPRAPPVRGWRETTSAHASPARHTPSGSVISDGPYIEEEEDMLDSRHPTGNVGLPQRRSSRPSRATHRRSAEDTDDMGGHDEVLVIQRNSSDLGPADNSDISSGGQLGDAQAERMRYELIERLVTQAVPADFDVDGAVQGLTSLKKARVMGNPVTGERWGVVRFFADPSSGAGGATAVTTSGKAKSGGGGQGRQARPPAPTKPGQCCENCATTQTPLWRKDKESGLMLCNACGIYLKTHGKMRPLGTSRHKGGSSAGGATASGGAARKPSAAAQRKVSASKRKWGDDEGAVSGGAEGMIAGTEAMQDTAATAAATKSRLATVGHPEDSTAPVAPIAQSPMIPPPLMGDTTRQAPALSHRAPLPSAPALFKAPTPSQPQTVSGVIQPTSMPQYPSSLLYPLQPPHRTHPAMPGVIVNRSSLFPAGMMAGVPTAGGVATAGAGAITSGAAAPGVVSPNRPLVAFHPPGAQ